MRNTTISLLIFFLATLCAPSGHTARAAEMSSSSLPNINFSLFDSTETRSTQLKSFTNWTGMLARFNEEQGEKDNLCNQPQFLNRSAVPNQIALIQQNDTSRSIVIGDPSTLQPQQQDTATGLPLSSPICAWNSWQNLFTNLRSLPPLEQLQEVNRIINNNRYIVDQINWGMNDYWETVFEFLARNGDCEDFAIAKYITLRALGWPIQSMRIVILRDTQLNLNHAVLAVYTSNGIYIGDNQVKTLVKAENIHHYRPIYSINEEAWWLHRNPNDTSRHY